MKHKGDHLKKRYSLVLVFLLFPALYLPLAQDTRTSPTLATEFLFADQLKKGMKGYGISAFDDNELQRFDVEILGVMYNAFAGMDMILARLSGPQFKEMGVIAGMSGSPVFIDGKMIGAVSYGWTFSKEPIAGITPIKNMLEIYERTDDKPHPPESTQPGGFLAPGQKSSSKENSSLPMRKSSITLKRDAFGMLGESLPNLPETITMESLSTPLVVSGCHPVVMKRIQHYFADTPFMPVMGGGARMLTPQLPPKPIENGSAIGIPLVSGTMDMSIIGTVTYRKGNKLVAFGHSFNEMGNVDAPMASAYIFTVIPSYARPVKLGASVQEVGSIRQDRLPAIGGYFGMEAPSFPVEIHLKNLTSGRENHFQYRIWENQDFSPMLLDSVVVESIMDQEKLFGLAAAKIHYTITLSDGVKIEKEDFFSTDMFLAFDVSTPLYINIQELLMNPYKKVDIANIRFDISMIDQFQAVGLETVTLDKDVYKPGDTVRMKLFFIAYRQPRFSRALDMTLPQNLRDGSYTLRILNGSDRHRLEYERSPGLANTLSFESLIKNMNMNFPLNNLYILLTERESGLRIWEKEMPNLPPSVMTATRTIAEPVFTASINMNFITEKVMDTDFEIRGSMTLPLRVNKKGRM